jgi:hypothetical protein
LRVHARALPPTNLTACTFHERRRGAKSLWVRPQYELVFVHGVGSTERPLGRLVASSVPARHHLNHIELAHRFEDRGEAEQTAERLNGIVIHGGEVVRNDGWIVVED